MFFLLAFTYQCMAWHILSLTLFLPLEAREHPLKILILLFLSLGIATMLILVSTKCMQNQARILLCIYWGSFWIHLLIVVYHFARICHNIRLSFVFWNLSKIFLRVSSQHLRCFPLSGCCKFFCCLVMAFHVIFANYSCTHIDKNLSVTSNKIFQYLHHRICIRFKIFLVKSS